MHPDLSFDQAPPISVPYRFFLTAPWFGVAAGLLLAVSGEGALTNRWASETLALVHLITAGFMLQAMCGALLQFVPVAAGANVAKPRWVAGIAHPMLMLGTIFLAAGFLYGSGHLLLMALGLLLVGALAFAIPLGFALWRVVATPALVALRLAIVFLILTVALGALLAWSMGSGYVLPLLELTSVHVALGLGGWSLVLLMGVSSYVVPMFQLTPAYPQQFLRYAPWAVLALIAFSTLPLVAPLLEFPVASIVMLGLLVVAAGFAAITIRLQMRRRRRLTDPTFWFFRGGMSAAIAALAFGVGLAWANAEFAGKLQLSLGVLLLTAVISAINGMLYKIVPFINWLHLQRLGQRLMGPAALPPNMRAMIPEKRMQRQMVLHFSAYGMLLLAVWLPLVARLAGLLMAASSFWLALNLIGGVRRYTEFRDRIHADASRHES